ncbi:hypothetical protein [Acetivibrio clariflavus]|uniref:Uncharacterized protein n=1 Tax=Acetivibrio clariflavus (strain DSM 19732 / NBRC 101661 / EBR45) TaxID=720554 RepID=G8M229_ACECE|nr:hypothetical protein [Acetivibrio clariflavus]AEV68147.1 hypothetical protein Clocl_1500 [Acetivibrio clariflavus DSM 19732]
MIQIDDAGSGSFVGGTCIGVYRPETNEYFFEIIPVELYNKENFKYKYYLDEVVNIVSDAFKAMKVSKNETIEICRGYMFEKLRKWLNSQGYCWYMTQISGRVQDVVEKNYALYTEKLGIPKAYIQYTKYPFHFHKLLRWVFADFENRIDLCKTGWNSWSKYEHIKPELSYGVMKQANIFCLKCGKRIKKGSNIRVLSFTSNREQFVYLHENC